ncbi:MAG: MATE family efflux transporter [Clostridiales Family XIII bacterium]|jgi:putative MATE family efflux protein|nr:MATE family efflux transporter [Clostridiales Family XIII bacterium]
MVKKEETLTRKLIRVALPISAQSLISTSLNLVDNLMVGHLGETELAAVGLSTQFSFIFWMVLFGFVGGTITYMSQFYGKNDMASIRRVTGIAITIAFCIGLAFFSVSFFAPDVVLGIYTNIPEVIDMGRPFMRTLSFIFLTWSIVVPLTAALKATQQTSLPLKISIVVFGTNTALGIILINGFFGAPRMGIMGAAVANVTSKCLELLLFLIVIFVKRNVVAGPIREFFGWTRGLFARVLANAVPTMANESLWGIGISLYNAAYGRVGVTEVAAVQASNTIHNMFSVACFSIGDAMLILCGEHLGRGELDKAREAARRILRMAVVVGLIAGAGVILTAKPLAGLYNLTAAGSRDAVLILLIYGAVLFVKIHNSTILTGALRAGGDTRVGLAIDLGSVYFVGVPMAFLGALAFHLPIYFVVLLVQAEELVKFFFMRWRFRKEVWIRDLVEDL